MRFLPAHLLIGLLWLGCGGGGPRPVQVEVLDRVSQQPLDSTAVQLFRYYAGGEREPVDTFWTDAEGRVAFEWRPEEGYQYGVKATRRHYQDAVAPDGGGYQNENLLQPFDSNQLALHLEPILPPDPERFARMHAEISAKKVVAAIQADHWTWTFLPRLTWEDIPALLAIAEDSSYLHVYPKHPRSRYQPDSVRAGLTALWLVEAIRRQRDEAERPGALMPPSRAPVLGTRYGNPRGHNSIAQIQRAARAYRRWWEQYGDDPAQAMRRNPLRGQGLSWM